MAGIVSSVLMLAGQGNFWVYALAMVISAWSYNLIREQAQPWSTILLEAGLRDVTYPSQLHVWSGRSDRLWERSGLDFLSMDNCIPDLLYLGWNLYYRSLLT